MFYPFVFFILAIPGSPEFGKIGLNGLLGYASYTECTDSLADLNKDLMSKHKPDTVRIIFTGCAYRDAPPA